MKAPINQIKITERIRKEITKIDELAADIEINGLLNPITVMRLADGNYQLLAGLRRLRAIESLGLEEIDVNIVSPADAEAALMIEISENEQREPFTFSEKMDYARMIEEIEREKARERKSIGGKGGFDEDVFHGTHLQGRSRDIVGSKIGMSGSQYSRAKHIAENATDEAIADLDNGNRTIRGVYDEIRSRKKAEKPSADDDEDDFTDDDETEAETVYEAIIDYEKPEPEIKSPAPVKQQPLHNTAGLLSKSDEEAVQKIKDFNALSPQDKIKELQRQLKEERARAAHAESELARLTELRQNDVYHKDGIIENLKARLAEAEARIEELEKPRRKAGGAK